VCYWTEGDGDCGDVGSGVVKRVAGEGEGEGGDEPTFDASRRPSVEKPVSHTLCSDEKFTHSSSPCSEECAPNT